MVPRILQLWLWLTWIVPAAKWYRLLNFPGSFLKDFNVLICSTYAQTFFVVGSQVLSFSEVLLQTFQAGHQIGESAFRKLSFWDNQPADLRLRVNLKLNSLFELVIESVLIHNSSRNSHLVTFVAQHAHGRSNCCRDCLDCQDRSWYYRPNSYPRSPTLWRCQSTSGSYLGSHGTQSRQMEPGFERLPLLILWQRHPTWGSLLSIRYTRRYTSTLFDMDPGVSNWNHFFAAWHISWGIRATIFFKYLQYPLTKAW